MIALSLYESQFSGESLQFVQQYLSFKAGELGKQIGYPFAEGFKVLTPQMLHMNVDAQNM